jgi:hypothetical protein
VTWTQNESDPNLLNIYAGDLKLVLHKDSFVSFKRHYDQCCSKGPVDKVYDVADMIHNYKKADGQFPRYQTCWGVLYEYAERLQNEIDKTNKTLKGDR